MKILHYVGGGDTRMKIIVAIAAALLIGCVAETEVTGSTEQGICTIEDQQSGQCTLRQYTRQRQQEQAPGQTPVFETWGMCVGNYCAVRWDFPHLVIVTVCVGTPEGPVCESRSCLPGNTCPTPVPNPYPI